MYCSISGFGPDGPYRDVVGYESFVHAVVGTMAQQAGHRDGPIFQGLPFASTGAAHLTLVGMLAALYRRLDDGVGRHVETSLFDGALAFLSMMWGESDASVAAQAGMDLSMTRGSGMRLITRSFVCSDDEYIGIHTGAVGAFGRLMEVLGLDDRIPPSETGIDMGTPLTPEQAELLERELHPRFASQPARLLGGTADGRRRVRGRAPASFRGVRRAAAAAQPDGGGGRRPGARPGRAGRTRDPFRRDGPRGVASGAHARPAHRRDPRRARGERRSDRRPLRSAPPTNVHCCTT